MVTKCIELEFPDDGRRKATIVTTDENVCKSLKENPDGLIVVLVLNKEELIKKGDKK